MTRRRPAEPPDDHAPLDETRVLPHDLEAEKAVLGAIIMKAELLHKAQAVIRARDFFRRAHQVLFEAFSALDAKGIKLDLLTVLSEVKARGKDGDVGNAAYITALTDGVPRSANVENYARIVREHAQRRELIAAANKILVDAYEGKVSPAVVVSAADKAIVHLQRGDAAGEFVSVASTVNEEYAALESAYENRGKLIGLTSGFRSIDELTHGWQAGDFIVIGARPSIGKTAFALNLAVNASESGKHVAFFSLEMRRRQLQKRLLSHLSGVPLGQLLNGYLAEHDMASIAAALTRYGGLLLHVSDRSHQTVEEIRTACRLLKSEGRLDMVIVDYAQLMESSLERGATRNEQLAHVSRRLKILADEVSSPVFLLSQLTRDAGKTERRPQMSDLRDTGAFEQDADIVAFLHREHHRDDGPTEFILDKQRQGPGGTVMLSITRALQTFEEAKPPEPEQATLSEAPAAADEKRPVPAGFSGHRRRATNHWRA